MKLVFTNSVLANCLITKEENHKRLKTKEKDRNNTVLHKTPPPSPHCEPGAQDEVV